MKVKEICGFWEKLFVGKLKYFAYYYAKIEDRYVILTRCLQEDGFMRGSTRKSKLRDSIMDIHICNDEKDLENMIQGIIQYKKRNEQDVSSFFKEQQDFEPLEMENGREIDLSLANIAIEKYRDTDQDSYEYVIERKREELVLDRLAQLQETIKQSPERYSVERIIKKYDQQSGTQLSEQQISALKDLDNNFQNALINGINNLEDYRDFLNSIPDLLSGKKIVGWGSVDGGGFYPDGKKVKLPSAEKMALYSTYTYRTIPYGGIYTMDRFRLWSSPSIKKRMNQYERVVPDRLCVLDTEKMAHPELIDVTNGFLTAGTELPTRNTQLSADSISTFLEGTSREGLITDVQAQLIGIANKELNQRSEKEL